MPKRRSRLIDYAVYVLVRIVVCIVQALPWEVASRLARRAASLACRIDRRHHQIAAENLRHAFPHLDAQRIDALVAASYEHFALSILDLLRAPRVISSTNHARYVHCAPEDLRRFNVWWTFSRPLVVVTGHFGGWELMNYVTGLRGFDAGIVARRLDNPYLDRYITDFREKTGLTMLDKNDDFDRIIERVASGGSLGLVGDQDAGSKGLFVEFLGRPASTFKSIALLSLQYQAPILVVGLARLGHPMQYKLYLEDEILPEHFANDPDAVRTITQRYSDALAQMVRRHPEQYLWMHRRWKHQPKARRKAA